MRQKQPLIVKLGAAISGSSKRSNAKGEAILKTWDDNKDGAISKVDRGNI